MELNSERTKLTLDLCFSKYIQVALVQSFMKDTNHLEPTILSTEEGLPNVIVNQIKWSGSSLLIIEKDV